MNVLAGWSATNRLVRRVRRHGALATLFRSSLPTAAGMQHSSPQLVMGQVQARDGYPVVAPEVQATSASASAVQRSPEAAVDGAARQVVAALRLPVNAASPSHSQFVPPHQPAPIQTVQAMQAAHAPAASPAVFGAAPSSASASPVQTDADHTPGDADQTWRRLQRIRQLHAQKLAGAEAAPSAAAGEVQRTPANTQFSASSPTTTDVQAGDSSRVAPPVIPASAAPGVSSASEPAQSASAQSRLSSPAMRSHESGVVMRSPTTASQAAPARLAVTPSAASPDAHRIDRPARGEASATNVHGDPPQLAVQDGVVRSVATDEVAASDLQRVSVEATETAASAQVAGALEKRPSDPPASGGSERQSLVQRAPLETAWPVIDDRTVGPVARSGELVQDVALAGDESIDVNTADVVRRQVAQINAQVATDSKIDVITPRRPPPFMRKTPAAQHHDAVQPETVQPETVQPETVQPEIGQSAPVPNLTQRSMVETEIGALPADLWRLIGEEAPVGNNHSQPVASQHDARRMEAASPVDAAVAPQVQRSAMSDSETSHPTSRIDERMVGVGAKSAVDDLTTVDRTEVAQPGAAMPITAMRAVGSVERQVALGSKQEAPAGVAEPANESLTPSDAQGKPAIGASLFSATDHPPTANGATQKSDPADEIFAVRSESTQSREGLAPVDLPAGDKSHHAAWMASASVQTGASMQTVQLAPIETTLQGVSRAAADVAAMGTPDAFGQQEPFDVDDLAQRVYHQLRRKLALEWERLRPSRY